jgi:acetyl-CoA acetyltransferase family protein
VPFTRDLEMADSTLGWRFINPRMRERYGVDSMPETAENVAAAYNISRDDQDAFAFRSQHRAAAAIMAGRFAQEIVPVTVPRAKGEPLVVARDEQPRPETTAEGLARLKGLVRAAGTVTAGNSTGLNDGACALVLASEEAARRYRLTPRARIVSAAVAGVQPRVMGIGPLPASRLALVRAGLEIAAMNVIELNEAFAAQVLAVLRGLRVPDDAPHVNPNGGGIALGHPLGASGARLVATAMYELARTGGHYALCTMCIGVGQGIAVVIERV